MIIEWIVVGAAVAGAVVFLGWRLRKAWRGGSCGESCNCASKAGGEKFKV